LRSLFPEQSERVNLVEMYSRGVEVPEDRPFVRVNMISTLDGATSFAGRSGGLGGPGDKLLFSVLRSLSDLILVGAGTARAEHYGQAKLPVEVQRMRESRGQRPLPAIAVVTQSLTVDWASPLFSGADPRPIIIAPGNSSAEALARAGMVADVLTTGLGAVDLRAALEALAERGMRNVLCEGGPKLNTSLAAAELVDELCLTLSPRLAGSVGGGLLGGWLGSGGRWISRHEGAGETMLSDQPFVRLLALNLVHVLEEESFLFLRLRPDYRGGSAAP
jgi:riboflavin biosynthesis pyrimidine reductase